MENKSFDYNKNGIITIIEERLRGCIPIASGLDKDVVEAMEYSLLLGGKRIRPLLTLEFCKVCGGDISIAIPFACAVEMIHSYSLIHDDLPCMDNDIMRRGKPSTHVKFGEDVALLAGDALLNLAFETMLNEDNLKNISADKVLKCAHEMAVNSGVLGMIGGQAVDLKLENKEASLNVISEMYKRKTGAIIVAACKMGCIVTGASEKELIAAKVYAESIGLAFQIVDDILDLTANEEVLGKPVNSDTKNKKSTYVSIVGLDEARNSVESLTNTAIKSLQTFPGDISFLAELANFLKMRNK